MPLPLPLVWMTLAREGQRISVDAVDPSKGTSVRIEFTLAAAETFCAVMHSLRKTRPQDSSIFDFGMHCQIDVDAGTKKTEVA